MSKTADGRRKGPIYPEDIEKYRKNIRIGQQLKIRMQTVDMDFQKRTVYRQCTVKEKYRWLFVATDKAEKRYTVTYIDQMLREIK